jgi:hypothetical protein
MEVLQWIDTGFRAMAAGFFALIPGMAVWTVILALYLFARTIVRNRPHGSPGAVGDSR